MCYCGGTSLNKKTFTQTILIFRNHITPQYYNRRWRYQIACVCVRSSHSTDGTYLCTRCKKKALTILSYHTAALPPYGILILVFSTNCIYLNSILSNRNSRAYFKFYNKDRYSPQTMSSSTSSNRCCQSKPAEQFHILIHDHSNSPISNCPDDQIHLCAAAGNNTNIVVLIFFDACISQLVTFAQTNQPVCSCSRNHSSCCPDATMATSPTATVCVRYSAMSKFLDPIRSQASSCPNAIRLNDGTTEPVPTLQCTLRIVTMQSL